MLSAQIKEHNARQQMRKEIQDRRKSEALSSANTLTHVVVDQLNSQVAQAYSNQKRLDAEAKKLQSNATQLAKQTQQWLQLIDNFNQALKELGDVENWARTIERDMHSICVALEAAYTSNQEARGT